jgi:hypothetical protein
MVFFPLSLCNGVCFINNIVLYGNTPVFLKPFTTTFTVAKVPQKVQFHRI